jgi:hypothetical protein
MGITRQFGENEVHLANFERMESQRHFSMATFVGVESFVSSLIGDYRPRQSNGECRMSSSKVAIWASINKFSAPLGLSPLVVAWQQLRVTQAAGRSSPRNIWSGEQAAQMRW